MQRLRRETPAYFTTLGNANRKSWGALAKIEPFQKADFVGIFEAMDGYPVTIRLLDPPLHEFLPNLVEQSLKVQKMENQGADAGELDKERRLLAQVKKLHEQNPMLGTRGCRLGMLYPEIPDMQARAIIRAVLSVLQKEGETVQIHIMIPLVFTPTELETHRRIVQQAIDEEFEAAGTKVDVKIGTMIELPRAALIAGKLAEVADFFSFGTNDLTQTTLGISRDDAENGFLTEYLRTKVLKDNPFASIDQEGVGQLVAGAVEKGRKANPELSLGICGEHGGDPDSIHFFNKTGLDYVSCSPFRVPIARFAAAQAVISQQEK